MRPSSRACHVVGWVMLTLLAFAQPPGRVAADTKFNLTENPLGFLRLATHAYTDQFTLGQIQNQAYGYLFPQGVFFLLPLPDWVLQRLWWALIMALAYSGTLILARRMQIPLAGAVLAGVLYALSPRILSTLTAISSEAWPVALVPLSLIPLLRRRPNVALSLVAVACMGAVNAAATIAACVPAAVVLVGRKEAKALAAWCAGAVAVSAWWIVPLLVLGRYSPPFTEFIESAFVTTHWLNPAEILRGTTSWAPFVDAERTAGYLLVGEPVFILATSLVAALGMVGLARRDMPWRGCLVALLALGVALLGSAHLLTPLYDGPLVPLRNLHKFDPLIRLPLALGAGWVVALALKKVRRPAAVGVVCVAAVAIAPAWSLRLLPEGTWTKVSPDWVAAGRWLDEHAALTRTLVVPAVPFARQTWGFTRDEPIQALSSVRFAVRDAIPLVDPEAIRGLDGQVRAVDPEALRSIGVGAVVVRGDLIKQEGDVPVDSSGLGEPAARFGELEIYLLEPIRDMMVTSDEPARIDGGGEVLPLLYSELGYFPATLTGEQPDIVTDTPAVLARNYGALDSPTSAHLADVAEGADVRNRVKDYPSAGTPVGVTQVGHTRASSSAADATAFGGADPSASVTAAFDGLDETAWWPAPGDDRGWIEASVEASVEGASVRITATATTTVTVDDGASVREVALAADEPRSVRLSPGATRVRLTLTERVGIRAFETGASRIVEVPGTADTYFFQRVFPATEKLQRRFHVDRHGEYTLSHPATIDGKPVAGRVNLAAGSHEIVTDAKTILISRTELALPGWQPLMGEVHAAPGEQLILTTRSFNEGLRARVGDTELSPVRIDAGMQAFRVPAGTQGTFVMDFAGEAPYRIGLIGGGALSALVALGCAIFGLASRRRDPAPHRNDSSDSALPSLFVGAATVALGPTGVGPLAVVGVWAIRRFTLIPAQLLAGGATIFVGMWLARAPWPSENYAGTSLFVLAAGCAALAALAFPDAQDQPRADEHTT